MPVTQDASPVRTSQRSTAKTTTIPRASKARAGKTDAEEVSCPTPSLYQQIEQACVTQSAFATLAGREDLLALRCRRVTRIYGDIARAGFPLERISELQESHARALVEYWRTAGKAVATIRSEWSIIRNFAKAIGKNQLDAPIERYWKNAPKAYAVPKPDGALPPRHQDSTVVKALQAGADRTHYFIERVCQVLRLTVQDALTLDPEMLTVAADRRTTAGATPRKIAAAISAFPAEVGELAGELIAFLREQDRPTLLWSDHSLAQAMRKHENHLAYVRRRRSREGKIGSEIRAVALDNRST